MLIYLESCTKCCMEVSIIIHHEIQVDPKKCIIRILSSNLFKKSVFTFPHVFWNQNFEPVSSSLFNITHSES